MISVGLNRDGCNQNLKQYPQENPFGWSHHIANQHSVRPPKNRFKRTKRWIKTEMSQCKPCENPPDPSVFVYKIHQLEHLQADESESLCYEHAAANQHAIERAIHEVFFFSQSTVLLAVQQVPERLTWKINFP